MALVGTTTASVVSTTPLPIAPMPAVTVAPVAPVGMAMPATLPAAGVAPAPAPAPAAVPPVDPAAVPADDAAMTMPSVKATDMFPGLPPEAAEALMKAAEANAAPAGGPEAKVIANWAERFGGFAVGATVKAMRDVVSKIAREKAEEVIAQVFHSKYPNLHVHGLLPPMPAPAPGPPMVAMAPGVPASAPAR